MSHFVMGCIIPKNEKDIDSFISKNMEKYDENMEVEPYVNKTKEELIKSYESWKSSEQTDNTKTFEDWIPYYYGKKLNEDGSISSTYNPNSKWDWYRIGGRWDGYLTETDNETTDNGFNFDKKHETFEKNMVTVEKHLENVLKDFSKYCCFGLLTKEGEWVERGSMGWWGMVSDEKENSNWEDEYKKVLQSQLKDDYIVSIDCHI